MNFEDSLGFEDPFFHSHSSISLISDEEEESYPIVCVKTVSLEKETWCQGSAASMITPINDSRNECVNAMVCIISRC